MISPIRIKSKHNQKSMGTATQHFDTLMKVSKTDTYRKQTVKHLYKSGKPNDLSPSVKIESFYFKKSNHQRSKLQLHSPLEKEKPSPLFKSSNN